MEQEEEDCKTVKAGNFWNNNKDESNGDRNKNLSAEEYLHENKSFLKDIVIHLQKADTCKIQLTVAINFISHKDTNKEQVHAFIL